MKWSAVIFSLSALTLIATCGDKNPLKTLDDREGQGRIPSCVADSGIDLFAVEGDSVISLSWNNNTGTAARGGYRIRYGTGPLDAVALSACISNTCEHTLTGLANWATYGFVVEALDSASQAFAISCSVRAQPHPLAFLADTGVATAAGGQSSPCITGGLQGHPLFVIWVSSGALFLSRSDDLGDTWETALALDSAGAGVETPRAVMLDRSPDSLKSYLYLVFSDGASVYVMRGGMTNPLDDPAFSAPVTVGTGTNPSIAASGSFVLVAYEDNGGILFSRSTDYGTTFSTPVRIDHAASPQQSASPSLALNTANYDVFVAYHGNRASADNDIYIVSSLDSGKTFSSSEVRIDDDTQGGNQQYVSLAMDSRSGVLSATWEDRRQGSDVYFAQSRDSAQTFSSSVQTGAGLSGDQVTPRAVIDPGRNVYVLFIDASAGIKPMFSRLNSTGTFDPALTVSEEAGAGGTAASDPCVYVDGYGTVFVVWTENRLGTVNNVFFARAE